MVIGDPISRYIFVPMLYYLNQLTMIISVDTLQCLTLFPNWIWLQFLILLLDPWRIMVWLHTVKQLCSMMFSIPQLLRSKG